MTNNILRLATLMLGIILISMSFDLLAHGVDDKTRVFLEQNSGVQFIPFIYIGAKHMFTGYDHLLFLVGVIFFLYRSRDVLLYKYVHHRSQYYLIMGRAWRYSG